MSFCAKRLRDTPAELNQPTLSETRKAECNVKRCPIFRQWNAPAHPAPGGFLPSYWFPLGVSGAACRLGVVRCSVFRPRSVNVGVFGQSYMAAEGCGAAAFDGGQ